MATRVFEPKIEAVGGLLVPNGAAVNKILTSDASGNATWEEPAKKKFVEEQSWTFPGPVTTGLYPGVYIRVGTGNAKKLVVAEYSCTVGEVEFEVRKNAEAATGFTALTASSTVKETKPAAVTLATGDLLRIKLIKVTTAPENLTLTLCIEVEA